MSGILLAFINVAGGPSPAAVTYDSTFSGAPISDVGFGG